MTATLHTFPSTRIVRLPITPRMTESDFATLRQRYPSGWRETATTDDGISFDQWLVPSASAGDDDLPALLVTLQPSGTWTVTDAMGRLIKAGTSAAEVL